MWTSKDCFGHIACRPVLYQESLQTQCHQQQHPPAKIPEATAVTSQACYKQCCCRSGDAAVSHCPFDVSTLCDSCFSSWWAFPSGCLLDKLQKYQMFIPICSWICRSWQCLKIFSRSCMSRCAVRIHAYNTEQENGWGLQGSLEVMWSNSPTQAKSAKASRPGPRSDGFWISKPSFWCSHPTA